MRSFAVIGGGIVGLATAWKLLQNFPGASVTVLEKETAVGRHQTGNNSGVLHCGLYYRPGSLKARLAVNGIQQMTAFCEENDVPFEICGKLVVATDEIEKTRLDTLKERGHANGVVGIRELGREEMLEREPNVGGIGALEVPQEGIVDYGAVCTSLVDKIKQAGGEVHPGVEVVGLKRIAGQWRIHSDEGEYFADYLVSCAGLHSDRVSGLTGASTSTRIIPFRGEYYKLKKESRALVNHLIYPVPDPAFPFLGVHFTRLIQGGIEAGPNAVLALAREGYTKTTVNPGDVFEALSFKGLWKFALKYPAMCGSELWRSFSKEAFCNSLQKLVPSITTDDLESGGAGVRAQAMSPEGSLVEDFAFAQAEGVLNLINAPSPAATASLAIADEIVSQIKKL